MQPHKLGKFLQSYQDKFKIDGKTLAAEIGIGQSVLTRLKQGKMPSAEVLIKILWWLVVT